MRMTVIVQIPSCLLISVPLTGFIVLFVTYSMKYKLRYICNAFRIT